MIKQKKQKQKIKKNLILMIFSYLSNNEYRSLLEQQTLSNYLRDVISHLLFNQLSVMYESNEEINTKKGKSTSKALLKSNDKFFFKSSFLLFKITYGLFYFNILKKLKSRTEFYLILSTNTLDKYVDLIEREMNLFIANSFYSSIPHPSSRRVIILDGIIRYIIFIVKSFPIELPTYLNLNSSFISKSSSNLLISIVKEGKLKHLDLSNSYIEKAEYIQEIYETLFEIDYFFTIDITSINFKCHVEKEKYNKQVIKYIKKTVKDINLKVKINYDNVNETYVWTKKKLKDFNR